jgi:hypothetical protein
MIIYSESARRDRNGRARKDGNRRCQIQQKWKQMTSEWLSFQKMTDSEK